MEQRDLLKDQVEQLGKVLARILSDFLALKTQGSVQAATDMVGKELHKALGFDLDELLQMDQQRLIAFVEERKLDAFVVNGLAGLLKEYGFAAFATHRERGEAYLFRSLWLYSIAEEVSGTASLGSIKIKDQIMKALNGKGSQ